jgi:beta-N-acetylhexosaminidase
MSPKTVSGPILVGIDGLQLSSRARDHLQHPATGGVVLFSRNFASRSQLAELIDAINDATDPRPLICIDQEGGRVQRLKDGFTALPPLGVLGNLYEKEPEQGLDFTYRHARVMAAEMLACGIDLSFAPVLDLDRGSSVIGDRSFSGSVDTVIALGKAYLAGMHDAGMKTTGKHFPGHGSVVADSHTEDVVDDRPLADLEDSDLLPFRALAKELDALMIAHVIYSAVDPLPAGYSARWLSEFLRGELGYQGVIMSDDLGMHAALSAGPLPDRCTACIEAGCDLVLVCKPEEVEDLLGGSVKSFADATPAVASLYGRPQLSSDELLAADASGAGEWSHWQKSLNNLNNTGV